METNLTSNELSEMIGDIYDSALSSDWDDFLGRLIDVTQSNKAFFFLQNFNEKTPLFIEFKANFQFPNQALLDYQNRPFDDPFYNVTKSCIEGEAFYCNKLLDISEYKRSEYYRSILKPMQSYWIMGGTLCRDGVYESSFAINRGENDIAYSEKDFNLIRLITPHLSRALHIYRELRLYKQYADISKSILDQQDKAIVVCDENGRVVIANEFANENLTNKAPIYFHQDKLLIPISAYQKRLEQLIKLCCSLSYRDIGTQESLAIDTIDGDNVLVMVAPLRVKHAFVDIDRPSCLVTVTFQKQLKWEVLLKEFGLTPKELQLLKGLYAKKRLYELNDSLGVSYNTLRVHLKSIFKKIQVNSQAELMVKINLFK